MSAVFDTDIFIDALKNIPAAQELVIKMSGRIVHSVVTTAELWAGTRPEHREALEFFLNSFHEIPMDTYIARHAGEYMRRYRKSHGVFMPDAVVAATAHILKVPLITQNLKHFPMNDIQTIKPY